jgi:putative ABC transport system permease protein
MMRAYDLLLHLYPASFRNEYGGEMRALFAERRQRTSGLAGALAFWTETIADTIANAVLVHLDVLKQDLAYTLRMLRRAPGFAATAIVIVALGIGATTAVFSVTDFALIRPLPFPDSSRLVKIWERTPGYSRMELSAANYRDWTKASTVFQRTGSYYTIAANMVVNGEPIRTEGAGVSGDLLPTLGVSPLAGRLFVDTDDREGAPGTLLLSYRFWQTQFGGDMDVIARSVSLDGQPYTIIGIMPRDFRFPRAETLWWRTQRFTEENYQDRNDNWLEAVGRLRPNVTIRQARAEMELAAAQSRQQFPKENEHISASVITLRDEVSERSRLLLIALSGAAACVLLIACANLANLLLARAIGRRRELAVRTAMGAGRERLVRQLMTESLLLAIIGGGLGVAIATAAVPLLARLVPTTLPIADTAAVDLRVLTFAAALTALTGIAFGLAPVARAGDADLSGLREGPRAGGGRKERLRSALVVAEIVASVVLLVSAGLLMRALWTIQARDPGFKADGVLTMGTALPLPKYDKVATREVFYHRVLTEISALPGVSGAAYVSFAPLTMRGGIWPVSIASQLVTRADNEVAFLRYVTPGYFRTLGIPVRRGRDVEETDARDRPFVAVVSESFVRRYWPDQDPIGRHFTFAFDDRIVVGVVGDVRLRGMERPSEPQVYLSYRQVADGSIIGYVPKDLVVRTSESMSTLVPAIRTIVRRVDPTLPVSNIRWLSDLVDLDTASRAVQLRVIAAFAVVAFVLAGIGIHGLLSFAVSQRMQEIGVRRALGAQRRDIVSMVMRRSAVLVVAGVIPGVALAYAAGRSMEALLAGVKPADAATVAAAVGLSVVMAALGTIAPTVRAVRIDPMTALRTE